MDVEDETAEQNPADFVIVIKPAADKSNSLTKVRFDLSVQHQVQEDTRPQTKQHYCELCWETSKSEEALWMHKKQVHEIPLTAAPQHLKHFSCETCSYETLIRANFCRHHRTAHRERSRLSCKQCDASFKTKFGLTKHVRRQHSEQEVNVEEKVSQKQLKGPSSSKDEETPRRDYLICSLCPYMAQQAQSLHLHLWKHHHIQPPERFKRFECPHCDFKVLSRKSALEDHMRLHLGEAPHQCNVCTKSFNSKSRLQNHAKTHTERNHRCTECSKVFKFASNLKTHVRTQHSTEESYPVWQCELCAYSSKLKGNLNIHLRNTHKQEVMLDPRRVRRVQRDNLDQLGKE